MEVSVHAADAVPVAEMSGAVSTRS
jgi:hypothetical protein